MSFSKIFLRYYPPGLALGTEHKDHPTTLKHIDLLDLSQETDANQLANLIVSRVFDSGSDQQDSNASLTIRKCDLSQEVSMFKKSHEHLQKSLKQAIKKLKHKLQEPIKKKYYLQWSLQSHALPLTNACFDRKGEKCLTGSYDRNCHITNCYTGSVDHVLSGHENVVYSVAFNYPICDKILTGSFDGAAKLWSVASGLCQTTFSGHTGEVVTAEFQPLNFEMVATAAMDNTARLFGTETAQELSVLKHGAEIIACHFNRHGNQLLTGSFDRTAALWDVRSNKLVGRLHGHEAELSNCLWNFSSEMIATSSLDSTSRIWDQRNLSESLFTLRGHGDEVLDICFDLSGKLVATGSSDCTSRVWNIEGELLMQSLMAGHTDEVSKVCFSPAGNMVLTASADKTARLWLADNGVCGQVLSGHNDEVFSCAFSYNGDTILTASKDNTCRLWR